MALVSEEILTLTRCREAARCTRVIPAFSRSRQEIHRFEVSFNDSVRAQNLPVSSGFSKGTLRYCHVRSCESRYT